MFSALLLLISLAALGQFGLYYWRAVIYGVAAQTVPDQVCSAAGITDNSLGAKDFLALLNVYQITPVLKKSSGRMFAIRAYYRLIETTGRLVGACLPSARVWSEHEMTICSRYLAVLVGRRMESNLACAAEIRSC